MIKISDFIRPRRALQKQLSEPAFMKGYGKLKKATESCGWLKKGPNPHPLITNHFRSAFFRLSFVFRSLPSPSFAFCSLPLLSLFLTIASCLLPTASPLYSAEFAVVDRFSVNNYSEFRGSVTIQGKDANPAILDARTQSGAAALFISTNSSVGIGTTGPSWDFHVYRNNNGQALSYLENPNAGASAYASNVVNVGANVGLVMNVLGTGQPGNNAVTGLPNAGLAALYAQANTSGLWLRQVGNAPIAFSTNEYERMRITASGNVGIATAAPAGLFTVGNGTMVVTAAGNVGIGTTSPSQKLQVSGGWIKLDNNQKIAWRNTANTTDEPALYLNTNDDLVQITPTGKDIILAAGGTDKLTVKAGGNVGIGTTIPAEKLTIDNGWIKFNTAVTGIKWQDGSTSTTSAQAGGGGVSGAGTTGKIAKFTGPSNVGDSVITESGGSIGIGTTGPAAKLHINAGTTHGLRLTNNGEIAISLEDASQADPAGRWAIRTNGDKLQTMRATAPNWAGWNTSGWTIDNTGYVGIGTTSPGRNLEVYAAADSLIRLSGNQTTDAAFAEVEMGNRAGSTSTIVAMRDGADTNSQLWFYNAESGTQKVRMAMKANGNIGIGTTSPGTYAGGAKLHVYEGTASAGNWRGRITASGPNMAVVMGEMDGKAWLGGHTAALTAWADLIINSGGGNVGIATTSPAGLFTVGNGTMVVTSGGSVGIGTTTPGYMLEVNGDVKATNLRVIAPAGAAPVVQVTNGAQGISIYAYGPTNQNIIQATGDYPLRIDVNSNEKMRILSNGNVGIATTSPAGLFTVGNGTMVVTAAGSVGIGTTVPNQKLEIGSNGGLGFSGSSPSLNSADKKLYSPADGDLEWMTNTGAGQAGFAISHQGGKLIYLSVKGDSYFNSGGSVGIGTSLPGSLLHLKAGRPALTLENSEATAGKAILKHYNDASGTFLTSNISEIINAGDANGTVAAANRSGQYIKMINGTAVDNNSYMQFGFLGGAGAPTAFTDVMRINGAGNVGIGTTSPAYKLDVNGDVQAVNFRGNGSLLTGITGATGGVSNIVNTNIVADSDNNGSGQIVFTTGITDKMVILNNGNVGIGITSPTGKLQVKQSPDVNLMVNTVTAGAITLNAINDANTVNIPLELRGSNVIVTAGNVGIGTTNPGANLHVFGANAQSRVEGAGGVATDMLVASGAGGASWYWQTGDASSGLNGRFRLIGPSGEPVSILTSGNIGIGTTTPGYKLHISSGAGETNEVLAVSTGTSNIFRVKGTGEVYAGKYYGDGSALTGISAGLNSSQNVNWTGIHAWQSSATFVNPGFSIGGSTFVVTAGNVGIGTTAPGTKLQVGSGATVSTNLVNGISAIAGSGAYITAKAGTGPEIFMGSDSSTYGILGTFSNHNIGFRTNNDLKMTIDTTGNVGIGTASPGAKLDIQDTSAADSYSLRAGTSATAYHLVVSTMGRVGIGTTSPGVRDEQLEVSRPGINSYSRMGLSAGNEYAEISYGGSNYAVPVERGLNIIQHANSGGFRIFRPGSWNATVDLFLDPSGNLGIGTAAPGAKLDIQATSVSDSYSLRVGTSTTAYHLVVSTMGNVGIGTTSPSAKLDVEVTSGINVELKNTNSANAAAIQYVNDSNQNWQIGAIGSGVAGRANTFEIYDVTAGAPRLTIQNSNGNVGIGTETPGYKLAVNGSFNATSVYSNGVLLSPGTGSNWTVSGSDIYRSAGNVGIGTAGPNSKLQVTGTAGSAGDSGITEIVDASRNGLSFGYDTTNNRSWIYSRSPGVSTRALAFHATSGSTDPAMVITTAGYVGIGTASPGAKLDIQDTSASDSYSLRAGTSATAYHLVVSTTGSVGIGTTGPISRLDVREADKALNTYGNLNIFTTDANAVDKGGAIGFGGETGQATTPYIFGKIKGAAESASSYNGYLAFATDSGGGILEKMRITSAGNVGIGTAAPNHRFESAKDVTSSITDDAQIVASGATNSNKGIELGFDTTNNVGFIRAREKGVSTRNLVLQGDSGNIGIGTTAPLARLQVDGTVRIRNRDQGDGIADFRMMPGPGDTETHLYHYNADGRFGIHKYGTGSPGGEVFTILNSGNVGIGTTDPGTRKLKVAGDIEATGNIYSGATNLLTGLTPAFSGWTTNPGTNADLVDELTNALTTNGVVPTGNDYGATITYDLGASKRIIFYVKATGNVAGAEAWYVYCSDDNITYYSRAYMATGSPPDKVSTVLAKCRYVRVAFYRHPSSVETWSQIKIAAYPVN